MGEHAPDGQPDRLRGQLFPGNRQRRPPPAPDVAGLLLVLDPRHRVQGDDGKHHPELPVQRYLPPAEW